METKHIHINDYDYNLPDEAIAKYPLKRRDLSKLLVYNHGKVSEDVFYHLPEYLDKDELVIFNNTKVIQARIFFRKPTGALVEVFLLEPLQPADYEQMFQSRSHCTWYCMIGNLKKWKDGTLTRDFEIKGHKLTLRVTQQPVETVPGDTASFFKRPDTHHRIDFEWDSGEVTFADILESVGELPIPPYLNRATEESDKTDYQTVYSKIKGSVAAPTAGLHFTDEVLHRMAEEGADLEEVTLHVGAGTFKPVKTAEIGAHDMHAEYIIVHRQTIEKLLRHEGKALAVGTTSVRTLESLYYIGVQLATQPDIDPDKIHVSQWSPYQRTTAEGTTEELNGEIIDGITPVQALQHVLDYLDRNDLDKLRASTQVLFAPGYRYKIVRKLITNFHQPKSTLLLLVSAFVGGDWRNIYDYALTHEFRFLSYGDACLLIP